jgi:hypothetical protein
MNDSLLSQARELAFRSRFCRQQRTIKVHNIKKKVGILDIQKTWLGAVSS